MKRCHVVRWQTPEMPAPAFWYFGRLENAEEAVRAFHPSVKAVVAGPLDVPDDTPLADDEEPAGT